MKLFSTVNKEKLESFKAAWIVRVITSGTNYWLFTSPFTFVDLYTDPQKFELKKGRLRKVYRWGSKRIESYVVPVESQNDEIIKVVE